MGFIELNDKIPNSEDLMVIERLTRLDEDNKPEDLHRGVGWADSLEDVRPADLRVRLSRGQLLAVERPERGALPGEAGRGEPLKLRPPRGER